MNLYTDALSIVIIPYNTTLLTWLLRTINLTTIFYYYYLVSRKVIKVLLELDLHIVIY